MNVNDPVAFSSELGVVLIRYRARNLKARARLGAIFELRGISRRLRMPVPAWRSSIVYLRVFATQVDEF